MVSSVSGLSTRYYKTQINTFSPFEYTALIDDDAFVQKPFGRIVDHLGGNHIAICNDAPLATFGDFAATPRSRLIPELSSLLPGREHYPYFNSGVILFAKSEETCRFFQYWHEEWLKCQSYDQVSLLKTSLDLETQITLLPDTMNFRLSFRSHKPLHSAYIIHFTTFKFRKPYQDFFAQRNLRMAVPLNSYLSFKHARTSDGMGDNQRELLCRLFLRLFSQREKTSIAIFGSERTSQLWSTLCENSQNSELFIIDGETSVVSRFECNGFQVSVRKEVVSKRELYSSDGLAQEFCSSMCNLILVTHTPEEIGSENFEHLIRMASKLSHRPTIIFGNANSFLSRHLIIKYLGFPDCVIGSKSDHPATNDLAVWWNHPSLREVMIQ